MIPEKTIKELINKHSILEKDLSSGTIDKKIFAEKSKEYSDLNEIVEDAKSYITYEKDKIDYFDENGKSVSSVYVFCDFLVPIWYTHPV